MTPPVPAAFNPLWEKCRYKVFYGGRGSGKSWSVARVLVVMAARSKLRILCAREFQTSIADSVHKLLSDQIAELGLSEHYEITEHSIRCLATGSEFRFVGLKTNIRNLKGAESVDIVWIEEAETVSAASWNILVPTIRKKGSQIWVTFNPDQESDPTFVRFVTSPPPNAIVVKVSWRDNPYFTDEMRDEKDHLARVDNDAYQWVWEGECRISSMAQVLHGKWRVDAFDTPVGANGPYFGADWGFSQDPTALVKMWIVGASKTSQGTLYIEHELYKVGLEINDTPAAFRTMDGAGSHLIYADCARPETISHVRNAGMNITAAEKWSGSVEDGIACLRGFEEIVIHTRCKNAVQEARLWSYKQDKLTGDVLPDLLDKNNHIWDAVRYGLAKIIKRSGAGMGLLAFMETEYNEQQQRIENENAKS